MTTPANPFVRYGTIASGNRFVGREVERASLRRRLYEACSSAALIGLTRMGKSSLANEILNDAPSGTRTGWVSIAEVRSGAEALKDILAICPPETALSTTFTTGSSENGASEIPIPDLSRRIR
jgi:AAA+ ATPase superfamily predicted ATPase